MDEIDLLRPLYSTTSLTRNNFVVKGLQLGTSLNDVVGGSMPSKLVLDFVHD